MKKSAQKSHTKKSTANARAQQMGLDLQKFDRVITLAGNPNTGKSTVFNRLTGLNQHTGNWPGKTVTRAVGAYQYNGIRYKVVDLPGTYSLLSATQDEEIARNFILFGQPDCTIVITDATSLERNLNLVLQVTEITDRVVVAVNLMDEARRKGIAIDTQKLSSDLGVQAVPITAISGEGFPALLDSVAKVSSGRQKNKPFRIQGTPQFQHAVSELSRTIEHAYPKIPNARWLAIRLLDGDARIQQALLSGEIRTLVSGQKEADMRFSKKIAVKGQQ